VQGQGGMPPGPVCESVKNGALVLLEARPWDGRGGGGAGGVQGRCRATAPLSSDTCGTSAPPPRARAGGGIIPAKRMGQTFYRRGPKDFADK
jgi:hypothetical protein